MHIPQTSIHSWIETCRRRPDITEVFTATETGRSEAQRWVKSKKAEGYSTHQAERSIKLAGYRVDLYVIMAWLGSPVAER